MPRRPRPMEPKRMHPPSRLHFVIRVKPRRVQRELPRETLYAKSTLTKRIAPQLRQRERDWTAAMILPITALRLAVAAAVENVTTPLPGDFPDGDVIIWRRSDEGSDNSTWLPPPLPSSFIPDKPDPGLTPDYNTRIRLPQNSTDVLTVADIAEIESMLVRLNETTNDTSSFESETPTERVRRSVGDEDEQDDDDDDNNVSPSKSDANSGLTAEGESVPGYSEDAQMRPAPKMDDQTSEFFSKFLGLKSDDHVEKTHEDLVEPSSLLQKDEDFNEQVRDRRQATATSSITSASNDVVSTTARSQKPTTVAPSEQQTPVVAEATTVVPPEETTLVVTQPTTIAASEPTTLKISQTSSEIFSPSPLPTENIQEKREEKTPGLPTTQPEVSTEQPVPEILSFPIQPSDFFSQGFHPPGFFPQGLFPQYPQSGYPQYPQNANPQYQQGGYPQYNQNANPQYQQGGYPQYSQSAYPQYPPGTYPQYPQGAYPQYPQYPQNQRGFYPNPSGIIDPGFAPDPNRQLLQRAREEQRQKGLRQPESHVPNSHWQGYPGGSGIIDPGFAPRPIDPLLQRDLDLQRENSGRQVLGGQQENKMTPELNIVHADGSTQGYPPNAPFRDQGAEAPRMDDTLIQQTQGQARQDQEQLRPPASQAETGNSAETLTPSDSAVPESNRE